MSGKEHQPGRRVQGLLAPGPHRPARPCSSSRSPVPGVSPIVKGVDGGPRGRWRQPLPSWLTCELESTFRPRLPSHLPEAWPSAHLRRGGAGRGRGPGEGSGSEGRSAPARYRVCRHVTWLSPSHLTFRQVVAACLPGGSPASGRASEGQGLLLGCWGLVLLGGARAPLRTSWP